MASQRATKRCARSWPLFGLTLLPLIMGASALAAPVVAGSSALASGGPAQLAGPTPTGVTLPVGGGVVAGTAAISSAVGPGLTVSQSSGKAIIDWAGFSIGQGGSVRFDNGAGATLNRVTGESLSSIDGLLSASGSVYLINPNGVIVGQSGVVDVGGRFVASTLDLPDEAFLAGGDLAFSGPSRAAVINYGKIGSLGGDVVMIASTVRNEGAITALGGATGLLAGSQVLVRDQALDGGRFAVLVGGAGTAATNTGVIEAAQAELRANGGNVYALAGDTGGVIQATGVSALDGRVFLIAGDSGTVSLGGTLVARGPSGTGGLIETSGGTVTIGDATLDAGAGGTWLLDPNDLTIDQTAANTIAASLNAGTSVTQQTTAGGTGGSGDITLSSNVAVNWTTNAGLTLSAYRNIGVGAGATLTSTGGGAVTLYADNTGTGVGTVSFGTGAKVSTTGVVSIYYNPISYTDAATRSTQAADAQFGEQRTGPYNAFVAPYGAPYYGNTFNSYMLVNTLAQLQAMSTQLNGQYALGRDIDATATAAMNPIAGGGFAGFKPIGSASTPFTGALNGQGRVISNLTINPTSGEAALFGSIQDGSVANLGVVNAKVTGADKDQAVIVGYLGRSFSKLPSLSNVYATGSVTGANFAIGGLVGESNFGSIANSYSAVTVSGSDSVGGVVGYGTNMILTNVYATGSVTASGGARSGGLAGLLSDSTATNVYATGAVTLAGGGGNVGGLIGEANRMTLTNAYATGSVAASGSNVGGLIGRLATGTITSAYANGNLTVTGAGKSVGGLIGFMDQATISNSYATGAVTAAGDNVGGLVGASSFNGPVRITNSFATGAVTSTAGSNVGGLVGVTSTSTITGAYASGAVSGLGNVGGLVGLGSDYGADATGLTISNSYATGAVTGTGPAANAATAYLGGLVGSTQHDNPNAAATATLTGVYATGLVSGAGAKGGLIGLNGGVVQNAVWDRVTTGQTGAIASGAGASTNVYSVQNTDAAAADYAYKQSAYTGAGFDFASTWFTLNGFTRPFLRSEYSTTITNGHQLQLVQLGVASNYTLSNDVSLAELSNPSGLWNPATGFVPLGRGAAGIGSFAGSFDGQNRTISGLKVTQAATGFVTFLGLFSNTSAASVIRNVSLTGVSITGGISAGGLVGQLNGSVSGATVSGTVSGGFHEGGLAGDGGGVITNSTSSANVVGGPITESIGGLMGFLNGGSITNSSATGAVSGPNTGGAGGLVGDLLGQVTNSFATGSVTGTQFVGGLVGQIDTAGAILDSYATGNVTGTRQVGGLVGRSTEDPGKPSSITGSAPGKTYASGSVTGTGDSIGGLVGDNQGSITLATYAPTGAGVTGASKVGGLVGLNEAKGRVSKASATGAVTGTGYTGGAVGDNFGMLTDVTASGAVSGRGGTGGLIGVNEGGATLSGAISATGNVTGTGADVGGLIGASFAAVSGATASGAVTGGDHTGGLIGFNNAAVSGSTASGRVTGADYTGGLVGLNYAAITGSHATGAVGGGQYVGGLVGWNTQYGAIVGADAAGTVTGSGGYVGGLAGINQNTITGSRALASATVSGTKVVGGLVGLNRGSVATSAALNAVTGDQDVGGLAGWNDTGATIATSYAAGAVTGRIGGEDPTTRDDYVGGLIGVNFGSASDVYATGAVAGVQVVGGLVGSNMPGGASITRAYSTGAVTASRGAVGGFAGVQGGTLANTYFQPTASGQAAAVGYAAAPAAPTAIGAGTSYDANAQATYQGFDFANIWQADANGPPKLRGVTQ